MPDPVNPRDRMVGAVAPKPTKLPPLEYPPSPTVRKVVKIVKAPAKKPVNLPVRVKVDDQYQGMLEFSPAYGVDAGNTYGPLGLTPGDDSPEGDKEFYCRIRITQDRVDPLLQGFKCLWDPPPGWVIEDGLDTHTYDEAVSNPVYVTRVYRTPSTISVEIGFKVTIQRKYLP
jgi:hypothetical protein